MYEWMNERTNARTRTHTSTAQHETSHFDWSQATLSCFLFRATQTNRMIVCNWNWCAFVQFTFDYHIIKFNELQCVFSEWKSNHFGTSNLKSPNYCRFAVHQIGIKTINGNSEWEPNSVENTLLHQQQLNFNNQHKMIVAFHIHCTHFLV